jgi:anaerobic magnesium-protoporphyrin IX monomethyl ester cyclase
VKILLIHPPWLRFFNNGLSSPPLALNGLASYIKRELPHHDIDIYNADHITRLPPVFYNYFYTVRHEEYVRRLKDLNDSVWREVRGVIADFNPDVLGIGSMTASYVSAVTVSRIAKQINSNVIVVLGGKHPSALPEDTLRNGSVDFVVIGEGEETFKELLLNLKRPEVVQGIAYRNPEGKVLMTSSRSNRDDINTLPFPIFESSINRYSFQKKRALKSFAWGMISARGCPFRCIYCASDKTIRYRSPENVVEEIMMVKEKYGINYFDFEDDSFSLHRNRTLSLCNYLRNQNVKWTCITRVDLIDESLVSVMKESGCISYRLVLKRVLPRALR